MIIKKIGVFVLGFVVGILALYVWGQIFDKEELIGADTASSTSTQESVNVVAGTSTGTVIGDSSIASSSAISNEAISIETQQAGATVIVKSVNLDAGKLGGWVVVHEVKAGVMMNALGAVREDSGTHAGVEVKLLRGTVTGGTYAIVLYNDNGDRQFSMAIDKPLKNAAGEYVMATFTVE